MAPRAYWKGYLKLSLVSCPVALFPASSEREKVSFNQINKNTGNRIRYRKVDAELFAQTMRALGLDPTYGAYLDRIPAITLATVNLMSWFGLHRRLRAAIIGHLALFEMTSSIPNGRYANRTDHAVKQEAGPISDKSIEG